MKNFQLQKLSLLFLFPVLKVQPSCKQGKQHKKGLLLSMPLKIPPALAEPAVVRLLDKTVVGTTLYPGAMVVSAKLASAVTFSENKPSERAKASGIIKGAGVVDPENLPPSTTSNPSGLV